MSALGRKRTFILNTQDAGELMARIENLSAQPYCRLRCNLSARRRSPTPPAAISGLPRASSSPDAGGAHTTSRDHHDQAARHDRRAFLFRRTRAPRRLVPQQLAMEVTPVQPADDGRQENDQHRGGIGRFIHMPSPRSKGRRLMARRYTRCDLLGRSRPPGRLAPEQLAMEVTGVEPGPERQEKPTEWRSGVGKVIHARSPRTRGTAIGCRPI
jgi:hypothetical protein